MSDDGLDLAVPQARLRPPGMRHVLVALAALALAALLAAVAVGVLVDERRAQLHAALEARLAALAGGRAEVLATWLEGSAEFGRRLTRSETLALFTREMGLAGDDPALQAALAEQLPYMQQVLAEFARAHGLLAAHILARDGRPVLSSPAAGPVAEPVRTAAANLLEAGGELRVLAPRPGANGLVVDLLLSIADAQAWLEGHEPLAGVLVMSLAAETRLRALLTPGPLHAPGERLRLLVADGTGPRSLSLVGGALVDAPLAEPPAPGQALAYGERSTPDGARALAVGVPLAGPPWTVVQEIAVEAALAPLAAFRATAWTIALLGALALAVAFAAFWWRQADAHHEALARQYRDLAARIQRHRRLLASVTDNVHELIGLKDREGRYRWVNPAFAALIGRAPEEVVGRCDAELLEPETASRLEGLDWAALERGLVLSEDEAVEIGGRLRHLQSSRVPLCDGDGRIVGLVSVARDVTELVERRRRHERAVAQAVDALMRTVELVDPYLQGHSRRVRDTALAVGRRMGLEGDALVTLELAASLSQIGKAFLPRELVQKPERHTPEETAVMQTHIDHALAVLADIHFDLPVAETVALMHERLDGSGYPRGLCGAEIGPLGRVLGVCDVFCARTEPRSYRDRIATGEALAILEAHPERYDAAVVRTLAEVVASEPLPAPVGD